MQFGTGSTTELTQKREGQSTKMPYVRPYICDSLWEKGALHLKIEI